MKNTDELAKISIDISNTITCRENRSSTTREINLPSDKFILLLFLLLLNNTSSFLITVNFGSKKIGVFTARYLKSLCCISISCRLQWEFCELISFVNPNTYECHFASMWIMQAVKSHPNGIFMCRGMKASKFWPSTISCPKGVCFIFRLQQKWQEEFTAPLLGWKDHPQFPTMGGNS